MNKMVNEGFAERVENPALTKLMNVWESKQARVAKQASGFGLIAVSLAACGGSSSTVIPDPEVEDGDIFNLTTGVDTPLTLESFGDSGILGDIFNAVLGVGIDGLVGVQTLQEADILVGTEEVDILNATLNGTGAGSTFAAPSITDIEVLNLTSAGSVLFNVLPVGLDLSNSTGYTQLWNIGSNNSLNVVGVGESAAIGLDDVRGGTTYFVEYTSSADTSVQNVIAIAVGTSEITGQATLDVEAPNGIDTLNLAVSDTVRLHLDEDAAWMSTFNITGSGVTQLSGEDQFPNLMALDSTGYTGDLTLDVSGSAVLESVLTDGGDDFITIQDINADGGLVVNLGAGDDVLGLLDLTPSAVPPNFLQILQGEEISSWDFSGGVSGVETLSVLTDVYLRDYDPNFPNNDPVGFREDATLDLDGFDGALTTVTFDALWGEDHTLALRNAPEALNIEAGMIDDVELDTGNIVDLTVTVNGDDADKDFAAGDLGELDFNNVTGGSLETLTLINTSTPGLASTDAGDINFNIDSDANHDVSALQTLSVDASADADVNLDADDADADMNALATVSVIAGDDADLDMDGVPASQQEQEFSVSGFAIGQVTVELPDGQQITFANNDSQAAIDALFDGTGYTADRSVSFGNYTLNVTREAFGPADPITIVSTGVLGAGTVTTTVTEPGVLPDSVMGLETVVVEGGESADVDIQDVYGSFTLDVTANGVLLTNDAEVDLDDTNVTEVTVTVNTAVEYNVGVTDHVDDGTGHADIDIEGSGSSDQYGNPFLTSLTVTAGTAEIDLDDDLSSMATIDLTGVVDSFDVDASGAEYAEGSQVRYLIGGTSSDITNQNGDSNIDLGDGSVASVREIVTFTELDFGTVVLNNFEEQTADPSETDRIDLSQLGYTNAGQLDFERGDYDGNGVFTSNAGGDDIRITDGIAGDGVDMSGEIIVRDVYPADDVTDLQANIVYT